MNSEPARSTAQSEISRPTWARSRRASKILVISSSVALYALVPTFVHAQGLVALNNQSPQIRPADAAGRQGPDDDTMKLLAHRARLEAEIDGRGEIAFPATLLSHLDDPTVARAIHDERAQFEIRTTAFWGQIAELERAAHVARIEIKSAEEKRSALDNHLSVLRNALAIHDHLATKGQALAVDHLNLAQRILDYDLVRIDVDLSMTKTQEDLAVIEQNLVNLKKQYRSALLRELGEIQLTHAEQLEPDPMATRPRADASRSVSPTASAAK